MNTSTATRRLSAAVLAGTLLLTAGTAGATAASAAPTSHAAEQQEQTQADAYALAKQLVDAKTVGDATKLLATAKDVPGADQAAEALAPLSDSTKLATAADSKVDGLVDVRETVQRLVLSQLNPAAQGGCATTDLDRYADKLIPKLDPNGTPEEQGETLAQLILLMAFSSLGGLDAPAYEALYLGDSTKTLRTFGEEQNKSAVIKNSFAQIKKFWAGDVETGPITTSAMKDDIVTAEGKAANRKYGAYALAAAGQSSTYDPRKALASTDPEVRGQLEGHGLSLHILLDQLPFLDGGESPLFTLNAYAYSPTPGAANEVGLPKRMVFGDGMLTFLRTFKYGDTGIKSVLGHEFGHHIQYVIGFDTPEGTDAERTRHSELEADSLSTYWSTHVLGGKYKVAEQATAVRVFTNVGDCNVEDAGHHGTPAQRGAAALFGQGLAEAQRKNKHVFAAESVRLKFNKELPGILAAK